MDVKLFGQDIDGNDKRVRCSDEGKLIALLQEHRDQITAAKTDIATGVETTILAADSEYYHDVVMVQGCNGSTNALTIDFRDDTAGTIRFTMCIPAGEVATIPFHVPYPQTAKDDNWTADVQGTDVSGAALSIMIMAVKNQ